MRALLNADIKEWVGREVSYTAPEELGRAAIRYFALALHDPSPLYCDETFAKQTRFGGIVAPPTLVCETNQYITSAANSDGYTGHVWPLPLPPSRMVRVANEYEFLLPVRPTDRITATWRLVNLNERTTRLGPMVFVESEVRYANQHGELLAVNHETVAFQPIEREAGS